jgi:hypothetical protein
MDNVLANPEGYEKEYVYQIKSWKDYNLSPFGFFYDNKEKWIPNPKWQDKEIEEYRKVT